LKFIVLRYIVIIYTEIIDCSNIFSRIESYRVRTTFTISILPLFSYKVVDRESERF